MKTATIVVLLSLISMAQAQTDFIGKSSNDVSKQYKGQENTISFKYEGPVLKIGTSEIRLCTDCDSVMTIQTREWAEIEPNEVLITLYFKDNKVIRYSKAYPYTEHWKGKLWSWLVLEDKKWACGEFFDHYEGNYLYNCYYLGDNRRLMIEKRSLVIKGELIEKMILRWEKYKVSMD